MGWATDGAGAGAAAAECSTLPVDEGSETLVLPAVTLPCTGAAADGAATEALTPTGGATAPGTVRAPTGEATGAAGAETEARAATGDADAGETVLETRPVTAGAETETVPADGAGEAPAPTDT